MVSEKIARLINEQIAHEQYAAQYYLSMSAWFSGKDLDGIANYFRVQSKEELMHADKMFDYLNDVGGEIIIGAIPKPPHEFESATDIFEKALEHEKKVTESIFNMVYSTNICPAVLLYLIMVIRRIKTVWSPNSLITMNAISKSVSISKSECFRSTLMDSLVKRIII